MGFNLKITGDGMTVDQEITQTQAGKIIAFLGSETESGDASTAGAQLIQAGATSSAAQTTGSVTLTVREMIDQARPTTHAQKITVFGHFIAQTSASGAFSTDEVKEQYQLAREKLTRHFSREVGKAVTAGWIDQVRREKSTYIVTRKGEDAIADSFQTNGKVKAKTRTKIKTTSTKATTVTADEVSEAVSSVQPVVPTLDGFPNYHKLKTKGLKVMWLLAMAQSNGIDSLSTKEIAYFTGKLRDKIDIRDISGHTITAAKNGWITKDNGANYSLLHDGEEHLKSLLDVDATD